MRGVADVIVRRLGLVALYPLIVAGLCYTAARYLVCIVGNPDKGWSIARMVDESANVDANGRVNETISARAAKARNAHKHWGCILCRVLGWIQPGHCDKALRD